MPRARQARSRRDVSRHQDRIDTVFAKQVIEGLRCLDLRHRVAEAPCA